MANRRAGRTDCPAGFLSGAAPGTMARKKGKHGMGTVLVVTGSYRKNANSGILADKIAEGARAAGHNVDRIDAGRLDINACRGCYACMNPGSDYCVINDDMRKMYPLVEKADAIILASPIYFFTMCGQIKQFLDRCFAVAVNPDPNGPSRFAGKKLGAAFVYGDNDPFVSGCVNAIRTLQDTAAYCGAKWAGVVYGSASDEGDVAKNDEIMQNAYDFGVRL